MKLLKKTKKNWILILGLIFLSLFLVGLSAYGLSPDNTRNDVGNLSFSLFIFLSVIIAPIMEEVVFRIYFLNKKIGLAKFFSIVFPLIILFYIGANYDMVGTIGITFFCIIFVAIYLFYQHSKNKNLFNILVILSTLIFGICHYSIEDFNSFDNIYVIFSQMSLSLFLIWITFNFGLIKSILFHVLFNFVIVSIAFLGLQVFIDVEQKVYSNNDVEMTYSQLPVFNLENSKV